MDITLTDLIDGRSRLDVTATWDEIASDYDELLAEYAELPIPGFRPGKAPRAAVERRFRKQMHEDLALRCTERLSRSALRGRGVIPAGPISISRHEVEQGESIRLSGEFVALPEFDLPEYAAVSVAAHGDTEKRDEISGWLLTHTTFHVPDALVHDELGFGGAAGAEKGGGEWEAACRRVKLLLILRRIALADVIAVDDGDVEDRIDAMAVQYGMGRRELRRDLAHSGGLSRLRSMLLAESVLDYLLEINETRDG